MELPELVIPSTEHRNIGAYLLNLLTMTPPWKDALLMFSQENANHTVDTIIVRFLDRVFKERVTPQVKLTPQNWDQSKYSTWARTFLENKKSFLENKKQKRSLSPDGKPLAEEGMERDQAVAERDQAIVERDQAIAERDRVIVEKDRIVSSQQREIAQLKNTLYRMRMEKDKQKEEFYQNIQTIAECQRETCDTTKKLLNRIEALSDQNRCIIM